METVMFNDGTEYECTYLATAPMYGKLYITIANVTYVEAAAIFSDENKTAEIHYAGRVFRGYTQVDVIINEGGAFKAQLSFPTAEENEEVLIGG